MPTTLSIQNGKDNIEFSSNFSAWRSKHIVSDLHLNPISLWKELLMWHECITLIISYLSTSWVPSIGRNKNLPQTWPIACWLGVMIWIVGWWQWQMEFLTSDGIAISWIPCNCITILNCIVVIGQSRRSYSSVDDHCNKKWFKWSRQLMQSRWWYNGSKDILLRINLVAHKWHASWWPAHEKHVHLRNIIKSSQ